MAAGIRYESLVVTVAIIACSAASSTQTPGIKVTSRPHASNTPASPVSAPPDAVFLFESGVVTYTWQIDGVEGTGLAWLAFDQWGRRQATTNNPKGDKVVIFGDDRVTKYMKKSHRIIVTSRRTGPIFTPEERRTLRDVLPASSEPKWLDKTIVGIRCRTKIVESRMPTLDVASHWECVGRGIPLEIMDGLWGPNVRRYSLRLVAIEIKPGLEKPELRFRIPKDALNIDADARSDMSVF